MPIKVNNLTHIYLAKTPSPVIALDDVSLDIDDHSFNAIVGETGSGKSTFVQHLNALLLPTSGEIRVDDFTITNKKRKLKHVSKLRKHVGVIFQFPEYQLFEESVIKDVSFGVKNFGYKNEEALQRSKNALLKVGLDESYFERSPFELSGGEKRRVALAGILAFDPDILILDEPTAGLDPKGANMIMTLINELYESGKSIILVTHDMNLVLRYCHKAYAFHQGKLTFVGNPIEMFSKITDDMALQVPPLYKSVSYLNKHNFHIDINKVKTMDDLLLQIGKEIKHD